MGSVVPDLRLVGNVVLGHPAGRLDLNVYLGRRSGWVTVTGAGSPATKVFENDVGRILESWEETQAGLQT